MARDLIPPPSPAGKPNPEGGGGSGGSVPHLIELPPEPARSPAQPAQQAPRVPSQYRNRFGFLLGALGGVVIAAVAIVVIVSATASDGTADAGLAPNWSALAAAGEVRRRRRAGDRRPRRAASTSSATASSCARPRRPDRRAGAEREGRLRPTGGDIHTFDAGHGVLYMLNGLGPGGSMQGGKPSKRACGCCAARRWSWRCTRSATSRTSTWW